jgi:hypothetical protein
MMLKSLTRPLCCTLLALGLVLSGRETKAEWRLNFNSTGASAPQASLVSQSDQREINLTDQNLIGMSVDWLFWKNLLFLQAAGDYNNFEAEETQNNIVITHHLKQTQFTAHLFFNLPFVLSPDTGIRSSRGTALEFFGSLYGLPLYSTTEYHYESRGLINRISDTYKVSSKEEVGSLKLIGFRYATVDYTFGLYQDRRSSDLQIQFQDGSTYQFNRNNTTVLSFGMRFK